MLTKKQNKTTPLKKQNNSNNNNEDKQHFTTTNNTVNMCRPTMNPIKPKPTEYMNLLSLMYRQEYGRQDGTPGNHQQRRRKVRFADQVETSSPGPLEKEELKTLWYDRKEISNFKIQARQLVLACCKNKRKLQRSEINELRGLESCTVERQLHRHRSIQCTLSAYKRGMSTEDVSRIYESCTEWNVEIAWVQACHDYCNIYRPEMIPSIRYISNVPPKFPFALKRVSGDCAKSQYQRRVRRRLQV